VRNLYERARRVPGNRIVLWGFLCLSVFFIFFIVFSGERESRRDFSISNEGSYIEGFRIVSKKDGMDALIITARRADFSKDETLARMDAVTMDIKKEGALLNADHGTYNMNTKDLTLEDNVTLRAKDSVVHAGNLSWNPSGGILSSEGKVLIENNKFTVEGEGLSATEDNRVKLMRNVKATFN
jgi:LPS export ABC transporter protein LptC